MKEQFDYLVFIGRMNPFHNGHLEVIKKAYEQTNNLVIILGSANQARNPHDPFTFDEREDMIWDSLKSLQGSLSSVKTLVIRGIDDYVSNDRWVLEIQKVIDDATYDPDTLSPAKIGIIGYYKDSSSTYLKWFPQLKLVELDSQHSTINATEIRKEFLQKLWKVPSEDHAPKAVADFMRSFAHTEEFKWLLKEAEYNANYNPRIYDNDIVACVDAVVVQSGHILLGLRKNHPGKGLLALPGGHVNKDERFQTAAIRELKEETQIRDSKGSIPPARLAGFITKKEFFDDPNRSLRARVTSMAYLFRLPDGPLYDVKGADDMEGAQWVKLSDIKDKKHLFFEDHYQILTTMLDL